METLTSQPVSSNNTQLRLRSQVLQIRLPTTNGGLIWNRPVALVLSAPAGREQILPILDVTSVTILALLAFASGSTFVLILFRNQMSGRNRPPKLND